MILPILAYGDPVLRKVGKEIDKDYPELDKLIENMWETMYHASGVGLAAPQIGLPIRLFIIDTIQIQEKDSEEPGRKQVFINAEILEEEGDEWGYEEGCLSIPNIREDVYRQENIIIRYQDESFNTHEEEISGFDARVIQHEYDHIEGILFTDHLKPLRKRMLKRSLNNISKGNVNVKYKMRFPGMKGSGIV